MSDAVAERDGLHEPPGDGMVPPLPYVPAPWPRGDAERVAALRSYGVLDTPAEPEFDAIIRLAARICDVPIALISLVDRDRQWFKSARGLDVCETPRGISFCGHAIAADATFVVPDTHRDPRFARNPLVVGEPHLRFYAGVVLRSHEGHALGTLCVLDRRARTLTADQLDALETLARQVMATLELRRQLDARDALSAELRCQLEAREALSQRLDAALRTREHLLAMVSHDLRTPLSTVVMTAQHFTRIATDDRQRRGAERLRRAAMSMRGLVDDLLDFESMDRGSFCQTRVEVPVDALFAALRSLFELAAAEQGVELVVDAAPDAEIWCDPRRVEQALANLVGNALKMTPRGGRVTLGVRVEADWVAITVRDTGCGFDQETRDKLFEPFWRATSAEARGAGLGLTITKRVAEAHGGSITASSVVGEGAVFVLTLPRRPCPSHR